MRRQGMPAVRAWAKDPAFVFVRVDYGSADDDGEAVRTSALGPCVCTQ